MDQTTIDQLVNGLVWTGEQACQVKTPSGRLEVKLNRGSRQVEISGGVWAKLDADSAQALGAALLTLGEDASTLTVPVAGKKFVFTGKFQADRSQLEARVEDADGTVAERVNAHTYVVLGELPSRGTKKSQYAARFGAQTLSEQELIKALDAAEASAPAAAATSTWAQ